MYIYGDDALYPLGSWTRVLYEIVITSSPLQSPTERSWHSHQRVIDEDVNSAVSYSVHGCWSRLHRSIGTHFTQWTGKHELVSPMECSIILQSLSSRYMIVIWSCHVDHIHLQLPLNSDKFNLCSCAIRRFSSQTECSIHRVRKSTPLDFWR